MNHLDKRGCEQVKEAAAAALARAQLQEEPEVPEMLPVSARDSGTATQMRPGTLFALVELHLLCSLPLKKLHWQVTCC